MKKGVVILSMVLLLALSACGNDIKDITGEWTIDYFQIEEERVPRDNIAEYMGENFAEHNSDTIFFENSGNVKMSVLSKTVDAKYDISGDSIKIYSDDGENEEFLTILDDGCIMVDYGNAQGVFIKK